MVTIIEKARGSSAGVIDYNEEKFCRGVSYFFWENFENLGKYDGQEVLTGFDVRKTLLGLEENPEISGKTTLMSFHMTVNPGPDDHMSEEDVRAYIHRMMEGLGYGSQPYVVYRHNDIDREHYHVVSSRVQKTGKAIRSYGEGYKVRRLMMEMQERFGYSIGNSVPDEERMGEIAKTREFRPEVQDKCAVIRKLFSDALGYYFECPEQFQAVLGAMNLKAAGVDKKKSLGQNMIIFGIDRATGKQNSRRFSMENGLSVNAMSLYNEQMERMREAGIKDDNQIVIQAVNEWCALNSGSEDEYLRMLDALNIYHDVTYAPEGDPKKRFSRIILACTELRFRDKPLRIPDENGQEAIYGHSVLDTKGTKGIRLSALNGFNLNGRWDPSKRYVGKKRSLAEGEYASVLGDDDVARLQRFVHEKIVAWKYAGQNVSKEANRKALPGKRLSISAGRK